MDKIDSSRAQIESTLVKLNAAEELWKSINYYLSQTFSFLSSSPWIHSAAITIAPLATTYIFNNQLFARVCQCLWTSFSSQLGLYLCQLVLIIWELRCLRTPAQVPSRVCSTLLNKWSTVATPLLKRNLYDTSYKFNSARHPPIYPSIHPHRPCVGGESLSLSVWLNFTRYELFARPLAKQVCFHHQPHSAAPPPTFPLYFMYIL